MTGSAVHLVRRFVGSLRPGGPVATSVVWVHSLLSPQERTIWDSLSGPDRRHSAAVARRVEEALGAPADRSVLAAALLHDGGKGVCGLRTGGRVLATLAGAAVGRTDDTVRSWSASSGYRRRVGQYWDHPAIGASILEAAGSDPLTVAWTREHHDRSDRCSLDPVIAGALRDADDD